MTAAARYGRAGGLTFRVLPSVQIVAGLIVLAALSLPLLLAEGGPLTSDESLYVAEGLNLVDGKGFTYTTGEQINHRGPLFPALLAADFAIAGYSLDHALWVPRLFALGSALLLLAIGWRFFGREAGFLAAAAALASALLTLMGTSLFLDGTQSFFLLLMLLCLHRAISEGKTGWAGAAGVALGLAMLTKESALLWLPLPYLAVMLLGPAVGRPRQLVGAYTLGFLAVAGWWWPYVYAVTGDVYLLGNPSSAALWAIVGLVCLTLVARMAILFSRRDSAGGISPRTRLVAVGALLAVWGGFFLLGLEQHSTWSFSRAYLTNVPDYTVNVLASWLQPLPLIAIAWGYVGYRAYRGSLSDRLLLMGFLLFLPFVLFVANRDLHVRDILPVVYLSYLALGRAAVDFARWLAGQAKESLPVGVSGAVVALLVLGALGWFAVMENGRFSDQRGGFDPSVANQANWDNPLARQTAAWVQERVPEGTPIMSGRLYSTHLYTLTDGRYPWWQLPTVRVDLEGDPPAPVRGSTLFRWEDQQMPDGAGEPWLYLKQYPVKGYYVALSERDLMAGIAENQIGYVIVTGDDAGFSSLGLVPYFEAHPSFEKVLAIVYDETNQAHIFRVVGSDAAFGTQPALVDSATVAALRAAFGVEGTEALLEGLSPAGYTTGGEDYVLDAGR